MKKIILTIMIFILLLTGCSKEKNEEQEPTTNDLLNRLSEEQIEYLTESLGYDYALISYTGYEQINWELAGTGYELYNPTSGVERFGVKYTVDDGYELGKLKSNSDNCITYEEAYELRLKDTEMRLEDFLQYKYEVDKKTDTKFKFYLPVEGLTDIYVMITVTQHGNEIHMAAPLFRYSRTASSVFGEVFSILYDEASFIEFIKDNKYSLDDTIIYWIQYNSVTNKSLILNVENFCENNKKISSSYKIYLGSDTSATPVLEGKIDDESKITIRSRQCLMIPVYFEKELDKGEYTFVVGNDEFKSVIVVN